MAVVASHYALSDCGACKHWLEKQLVEETADVLCSRVFPDLFRQGLVARSL